MQLFKFSGCIRYVTRKIVCFNRKKLIFIGWKCPKNNLNLKTNSLVDANGLLHVHNGATIDGVLFKLEALHVRIAFQIVMHLSANLTGSRPVNDIYRSQAIQLRHGILKRHHCNRRFLPTQVHGIGTRLHRNPCNNNTPKVSGGVTMGQVVNWHDYTMQCLDTASEQLPDYAVSNVHILADVTVRPAGFFFLCIVIQEPVLPTNVSPCTLHVMWGNYSLAIFCNQQVPRQQKLQTAGTKTVISHSNQVQHFFTYSV